MGCISLPVGLRIPWRRFNVFKLVLGDKRLKLSTVELWQLKEIRTAVSCIQVLGAIELEQVCRDALPWSFRYFVTFQRFFLLLWFVAVANVAS